MKNYVLPLLGLCVALCSEAANISDGQALEIAQHFFSKNVRKAPGAQANAAVRQVAAAEGYFAFNRGNKAGYVIVSSNDAAVRPVLGYSDAGEFDPNNIPANMQWWLEELNNDIEHAFPLAGDARKKAPRNAHAAIEPLLKTNWNQGAPYNNLAPMYGDQHCATGCVATALAQVMNYHQYPEVGTGSFSYEWEGHNETLSSNFAEHHYNWGAMANNYEDGGTYTEEQKDAVAQLMYDIGVSVQMVYGPTSGAYSCGTPVALVKYFSYDPTCAFAYRDFYETQEWIDLLYNELENSRPIFFSGISYQLGGHAFVMDGYNDGYFHINWGWAGDSNGYFLPMGLDPWSQGISDNPTGFNSSQAAIINCMPAREGSTPLSLFYSYSGISVQEESVTRSEKFSVNMGILNSSNRAIHTHTGIRVQKEDSEDVTYILGSDIGVINPSGAITTAVTFNAQDMPSEDGIYIITPAVMDEYGVWNDMRCSLSTARQNVIATVEGDKISFVSFNSTVFLNTEAEVSFQGKLFVGREKNFIIKQTNNGEDNVLGYVILALYDVDTKTFVTQNNMTFIYLEPGKSNTYDMSLQLPDEAGDYLLVLYDEDNPNFGTSLMEVTVYDRPLDVVPELAVTQPFEMQNPEAYDASNNINIFASITCKEGVYEGRLASVILYKDKSLNHGFTYQFSLAEGEIYENVLPASEPLTQFVTAGESYYATAWYLSNNQYVQINDLEGNPAMIFFTVYDPLTSINDIVSTNDEDITIYDLKGNVVMNYKAGEAHDMSQLSDGFYVVKPAQGAGRTIYIKK